MPSDPRPLPHKDMPDSELALWMLERMRDSEEFLGVLQKARKAGARDVLDTPDYVARHKARLAKLYKSDTEDDVTVSATTIAKIEMLMARDMLSSPEEFIEKALAAYIEKHPRGAEGIDGNWQSTFEAARAEIEGRTQGMFEPGFTAGLAASAREELARQAGDRTKVNERGGREG
ncbi:MAG: hypothetical protein ABL904_24735 [Hyphomicrobiaceae bacterium]